MLTDACQSHSKVTHAMLHSYFTAVANSCKLLLHKLCKARCTAHSMCSALHPLLLYMTLYLRGLQPALAAPSASPTQDKAGDSTGCDLSTLGCEHKLYIVSMLRTCCCCKALCRSAIWQRCCSTRSELAVRAPSSSITRNLSSLTSSFNALEGLPCAMDPLQRIAAIHLT